MKLDGGEGRNRTDECSFCRAVPYHLATPPFLPQDTKSQFQLKREDSEILPNPPIHQLPPAVRAQDLGFYNVLLRTGKKVRVQEDPIRPFARFQRTQALLALPLS
jgi:hypothetical protein